MEDKDTKMAGPGPERTVITLQLEAEDAQRFNEAFRAGKLAEFGIVDIQPVQPPGHNERNAVTPEKTHQNRDGDSRHKPRQR